MLSDGTLTRSSPSRSQLNSTPEPTSSFRLFRWKTLLVLIIATALPRGSKAKKYIELTQSGPVRFQLPFSGEIGGGGRRSIEPVARATPPPVKASVAAK